MQEYLTLKQLRDFSFNKIVRLQNLRFRATCSHLLPFVPFYAKLFKERGVDPASLKSVEDWQRAGLPLVKKSTYLNNPTDFVVTPAVSTLFWNHLSYLLAQDEYGSALGLLLSRNKREILTHYYSPKMLIFSGGTESGNPAPVLLTGAQKFDTLMPLLKLMGSIVFEKQDVARKVGMNLFPYAPHLGWHAVHHALDINADLNLCTAAGGAIPTERLVTLAGKAKPNIICGMSDYLRNRFLPLAIEQKITLPEQVLFVCGAQKMLEPERAKIAELASRLGVRNCTVLDLYGASELKEALMPECVPGSGFHHIAPLSTIVRTVSVSHSTDDLIDEWDFSPDGYAASWNIDGAGSLLEGYLIGDTYEKVVNERCSHCALNVTRIYNVNRIADVEAQMRLTGIVEEKVKGARVNLVAFRERALALPSVKEAQVALMRKKNQIEIRFVSDAPKNALNALKSAFVQSEIKPKLVLSTLKKLQGDKLKFEAIKLEP